MVLARIAFTLFLLNVAHAAPASAQQICDLSKLAPVAVGTPETTTPGMRAYALECGNLRVSADAGNGRLAFALSKSDGRPVFDAEPVAFELYGLVAERIAADFPGVAHWTASVRGYAAFGTRLAAAAASDSAWNATRGRPRRGAPAAYVVALAQRAGLTPEFSTLAARLGGVGKIAGAENIMLCPAPGARLRKLPCGGAFWFSIDRKD